MRFYLRLSAEILITAALVVLGFVAYLYWGTAAREGMAQRALASELSQQWSAAGQSLIVLANPDKIGPGEPIALIRIPKLGTHWQFAVVQGAGAPQLALGPGHVPGTAMPGMVGNFVIAGHRVSAGHPFWNLPSLRAGDVIDIETIAGTYEYEVTGKPTRVSPGDLAALAPAPDHPGRAPSRRMITLITGDPPWTGTSRVIVTGVLIKATPRQQGTEG
jgi:sortase A